MKRIKRLIRLIIIGGIVYLVYSFFLAPTIYTSQVKLVNQFFIDLNQPDVCNRYFQEETQDVCLTFVTSLDGVDFTLDSITKDSDEVKVVLVNSSNQMEFTFRFVEYNNKGIRQFVYPHYYYIDIIK
jgi:hypothetical protein